LLATDRTLVALILDFDSTLEWREAVEGPHYEVWRHSSVDVGRVKEAVAEGIIRKLRDPGVHELIVAGDVFWGQLAVNVARADYTWHQSGRIKVNAMRALRWRLACDTVTELERRSVNQALEEALVRAVDQGADQEFKAITKVARAVAHPSLIAKLEYRSTDATEPSVRINARRMLDYINGQPYRRYSDSVS
jgi:hypothetical protein